MLRDGKLLWIHKGNYYIGVFSLAPRSQHLQLQHLRIFVYHFFDLLSVNPHKMVKHTQIICGLLPTNYLSVFDHLVVLALKGLRFCMMLVHHWWFRLIWKILMWHRWGILTNGMALNLVTLIIISKLFWNFAGLIGYNWRTKVVRVNFRRETYIGYKWGIFTLIWARDK